MGSTQSFILKANLDSLVDWFSLNFVLNVLSECLVCYCDSNDVYDFDIGADKNKKESVVNLVGRLEMVVTNLPSLPILSWITDKVIVPEYPFLL